VIELIVRISSGIPGLDELIGNGGGSFAENTVTLIYGPPKVGKSIFSYQFAYRVFVIMSHAFISVQIMA